MPGHTLIGDIYSHMPFISDTYFIAQADGARLAWFLIGWLGVVGAVFGSFLNVVIYRLPLGMSLSFPGSRCPVCKHPIRWHDNVPVLGWLWLGGRCRDCRARISPRYPLVELWVAALFAGLAWLEVFQSGINLPVRPALDDIPPASLWLQYAYHLALACTVVCAGLMEYDGQSTPRRLWLPALTLGLVLPAFWPTLHPVPFMQPLPVVLLQHPALAGIVDGLFGLAAGAGLGWLFGSERPLEAERRRGTDAKPAPAPLLGNGVVALAVVGSYLGWQAVCWVVILGSVLQSLTAGLAHFSHWRGLGLVACVSLATQALLPAWRWLDATRGSSDLPSWLVLGVAAVLVAVGRRWFSRSSAPSNDR